MAFKRRQHKDTSIFPEVNRIIRKHMRQDGCDAVDVIVPGERNKHDIPIDPAGLVVKPKRNPLDDLFDDKERR